MARTALLLGATGLVGSFLLDRLLAHPAYERISVLTRRPTGRAHPRLDERVADFGQALEFPGAEDVFVALGTTMARAGSPENFRAVDHDLVVEVARAARAKGARRLLLVSSAGADPASRLFYNRVKGETERDVAALGWDACHLFRPSLLLGPRSERRPGERAGIAVARALRPLLPRALRPTAADAVAAAMVEAATRELTGRMVWDSGDITALAVKAGG